MDRIAEYRKPIAGIITGGVALAAAFGLDVPLGEAEIGAIALLLANVAVFIVPNKHAP